MEYIIITLVAIAVTTCLVYFLANKVFNIRLRLKSLVLCAACALFLSLILPRIIVSFTGLAGTVGFLALFAVIFAYCVAYYDEPADLQPAGATPGAIPSARPPEMAPEPDAGQAPVTLALAVADPEPSPLAIGAEDYPAAIALPVDELLPVTPAIVPADTFPEAAEEPAGDDDDPLPAEAAAPPEPAGDEPDVFLTWTAATLEQPAEDETPPDPLALPLFAGQPPIDDDPEIAMAEAAALPAIEPLLPEPVPEPEAQAEPEPEPEQEPERAVATVDDNADAEDLAGLDLEIELNLLIAAGDAENEELPEAAADTLPVPEILPVAVAAENDRETSGLPAEAESLVPPPPAKDDPETTAEENPAPARSTMEEAGPDTAVDADGEPLPEELLMKANAEPPSDKLDDLLEFAFTEKDRGSSSSALDVFRRAFRLYRDSQAGPLLAIEIAGLLKAKGAYDEAVVVLSEGRNLPAISENAALDQEFINTIAYLRIVKNTLLQNRIGFVPFKRIPADIAREIDEEFREWRNLA